MSKIKNGNTVRVHYVGTLDDGTEFDNSRTRNSPLTCRVGAGQLITGFDSALVGMKEGETKKISLEPADAYGDIIPEALQVIPKSRFPSGFNFGVGETVQGERPDGQAVRGLIEAVDDEQVTLNFNHPMAGKNLNFEIEVLKVE